MDRLGHVFVVVMLVLGSLSLSAVAFASPDQLEFTAEPLVSVNSLAQAQQGTTGANTAEQRPARWMRLVLEPRGDAVANSSYYLSIPRGAMRDFVLYEAPDYTPQSHSHLRQRVTELSTINSIVLPLADATLAGAPAYIEVREGQLPSMLHVYHQDRALWVLSLAETLTASMRALMVFTILFAFFLWVKLRSPVFLAYGAFIGSSFVLYFSYLDGWVYYFPELVLPFHWQPLLFSLIGSCCYFFALVFTDLYGQYHAYLKGSRRWVQALRWWLLTIVATLLVTGGAEEIVAIANLSWLLVAWFIWGSALLAWRCGSRYAIYLVVGWTPFIIAAVDMLAIAAGWKPGDDINLIAFDAAVIFELIVFQLGLADMVLSFRQERDKAAQLAFRDALSGAYNRHGFQALIDERLQLAKQRSEAMAVALLDIDHFKKINDEHGHDVGDRCIQTMAARIQEQLRESDLLVRYGGEEFLLVLPRVSLKEAEDICERIRNTIASLTVPIDGGQVAFTASLGLSSVDLTTPMDESIKAADEALYQSKRDGRNALTVAA